MDKFDVEHLQKLTYNRSQTWSSFFETFENNEIMGMEDEVDIDVREIETIFSTENNADANDDLMSMEDENYSDDVNSEFLQNASSHSQFSLFNGNASRDLLSITNSDEKKQFVDLINKTLPVCNEHNRQLKELGFDRVLTSFNKDEIENKFGSWLNRNNSLFLSDNSVAPKYDKKRITKIVKRLPTHLKCKFNIKNKELDSDSDASLQSGETARYIRSSRVNRIRNPASTLIKTYRTINTRASLREQYAVVSDDDDYENDFRFLKKREIMTSERKVSTKTRNYTSLRKRANTNNDYASYSSSDSDYSKSSQKYRRKLKHSVSQNDCFRENYFHTPLTSINKNRKILKTMSNFKMSSAIRNRMYFYSRPHSMSVSSSSSNDSMREKRRATKKNAKLYRDDRQYKRESECCCYNDNALCTKFKHVANSSTDEWFVENECSKTPLRTSQAKVQTTRLQKWSACKSQKPYTSNELKPTTTAKKKLNLKKNEKASELDESFELKFQRALEASKKSYEKEQKNRSNNLSKIKEESLPREAASKKNNSRKPNKVVRKSKCLDELKQSLASKKGNETNYAFAKTQGFFNSTALSTDGRAFKTQFADHKKIVEESETESTQDDTVIELAKTKSAKKTISAPKVQNKNVAATTVTSTTIRSPDLHMSVSSPQTEGNKMKQNVEINYYNRNDCTNVTSTTNAEVPVIETTNKQNKEPKKTASKQSLQNRILIYDPDNQNMLSPNSCTKTGYFTVTGKHLSGIFNEKSANKFLKYHIGRKRFKINSKVYYRPPNNSFQFKNLSSSSGSSDDLENLGKYGDLFAIDK